MKIKTQVRISIIVFVILAVVITSSYFSSANQLHEIQKKQQIIDTIEKSSFELYYLENDYNIHGGTRTVERWNAKYAELTGQLKELRLTDPSQQAVLNSLLDSHADLQTTFLNLVATTVSAQGKESNSANQKVKEFAASTLTGHTQMMMASSSELSQMVKTEAIEVEQRTTLIISSSIAVLMIFVLLNYLLINRSVLRSISMLEKGAGRIGSGDLDTKIETGSNDELGELSLAITAMASNLKTVLTSKSNLENEVAERKKAEEALLSVNEELTAIEKELRANLDERIRQELTLRLSEEALNKSNKKLTLLSSITRHDINNQLTVLVGYLTLLKKKQPDTTHDDYFQKIASAAHQISSMIQFTREYEDIGVKAPAWQDCRSLVDTAAKEAHLGKVMVINDLPAGAEVFADSLVVKVFYNLMDNAVKYGQNITFIRFFVKERDGDHVLVCEDDGVGVPAEEKEKIFRRGFGKNTGLGLSLSQEILSITGITIRENGEPGKGARFEMTVPKRACRFGAVE